MKKKHCLVLLLDRYPAAVHQQIMMIMIILVALVAKTSPVSLFIAVLVHGTRHVVLPQTAGGNWHLCGSRKWFWPEGWNLSLQVGHGLALESATLGKNIYLIYSL